MLKINHASDFRRTVAGLCMISAPLAFMVSEGIYSLYFSQESDRQFFAMVDGRFGLWIGATLLGMLAAVLFIPAVVGMVHPIRNRGVVLGHIGGALAVVGAVGYAAHQMMFVVLGEMARIEGRREAVTSVSERLDESVVIGVLVMLVFLLSFSLGLILLTSGLFRAGVAPVWSPVFVFLSILPAFVPVSGDYAGYAGFVLLAAGLGVIGVKVLRMSDEEWERGVEASAEEVSFEPRTQTP